MITDLKTAAGDDNQVKLRIKDIVRKKNEKRSKLEQDRQRRIKEADLGIVELDIKKANEQSEIITKRAIAMEFQRRKQEETERKEKERNKQMLDSNIIAQVVEAQKGKKRKVQVQKDSNVVSRRASSQTMLPKVVKNS